MYVFRCTRQRNFQVLVICSNNSFSVKFCLFLRFHSQNKIFNISSLFPSQQICSSPPSWKEEEQIKLQNLIFGYKNKSLLYFHMECLVMSTICDSDQNVSPLECETGNRKFWDLSLSSIHVDIPKEHHRLKIDLPVYN